MHLSRLGAEIVLWSSQEFGFCEPADSFASGSSIMPQKKNPDAAELLRGKAPRVAASLASLLGTMHALPLAYSKDMQEDKEPLFDAIDNLELCLEAAAPMLEGLSFNRERLAEAAERRVPGRDRPRRRAGRARACPSARPTGWSPGWSGPPSTPASSSPSSTTPRWTAFPRPRASACARRWARAGPSSRRSPRAEPPRRSSAHQLDARTPQPGRAPRLSARAPAEPLAERLAPSSSTARCTRSRPT